MFGRLMLVLALTSFVGFGCSSGSSAEKSDEKTEVTESAQEEAAETTETTEAPKSPKADLADCTGGAVPQGATSCRLDLATGQDSHWTDTDGVDPGTAGCHYEFEDASCTEFKEGRTFGEFCLDDDRLVESNPGKDECHTHGADFGGPDVVSCSQWCQEQSGVSGACEGGQMVEGKYGSCESARCVCAS